MANPDPDVSIYDHSVKGRSDRRLVIRDDDDDHRCIVVAIQEGDVDVAIAKVMRSSFVDECSTIIRDEGNRSIGRDQISGGTMLRSAAALIDEAAAID